MRDAGIASPRGGGARGGVIEGGPRSRRRRRRRAATGIPAGGGGGRSHLFVLSLAEEFGFGRGRCDNIIRSIVLLLFALLFFLVLVLVLFLNAPSFVLNNAPPDGEGGFSDPCVHVSKVRNQDT